MARKKKHLKTGDRVVIVSGDDRGSEGTVVGTSGSGIMVRLDRSTRFRVVTLNLLPSSVKKVVA